MSLGVSIKTRYTSISRGSCQFIVLLTSTGESTGWHCPLRPSDLVENKRKVHPTEEKESSNVDSNVVIQKSGNEKEGKSSGVWNSCKMGIGENFWK